ncbi:hypothetical protein ACJMK2_029448, partial [Sinanodonta woodiana]
RLHRCGSPSPLLLPMCFLPDASLWNRDCCVCDICICHKVTNTMVAAYCMG